MRRTTVDEAQRHLESLGIKALVTAVASEHLEDEEHVAVTYKRPGIAVEEKLTIRRYWPRI